MSGRIAYGLLLLSHIQVEISIAAKNHTYENNRLGAFFSGGLLAYKPDYWLNY